MVTFIVKVFQIVPLLIVNAFGFVQVIIKVLKEVATAVVNLLFPFFPDGGKFETAVLGFRAWIDKADEKVEQVKQVILGLLGLGAK